MEAVSEEPQQNTAEAGASSGPDSSQGSPPKDQNQNKPSKPSSSPSPAASTGTSKGGLILDTNIKRDDPSAAQENIVLQTVLPTGPCSEVPQKEEKGR